MGDANANGPPDFVMFQNSTKARVLKKYRAELTQTRHFKQKN